MIIFLCLILISISLLIFVLIQNSNLNFGKNILITLLCTIIILNIVLKPAVSLSSALNGIKLFINSVFVSIFPFLVLINIMIQYDGISIYSKLFGNFLCRPMKLPKECSVVLTVSILCGYPLGAKYACDLYEKGSIDYKTCERLINIASNPSPLFVIGAVGTSMLKNPSIGILLLISSYLSCAILGVFLPKIKHTYNNKKIGFTNTNNQDFTFGDVMKSSIDNAFKVSTSIGGFIIFFSVISSIIKNNIMFDIVLSAICEFLKIPIELLQGIILGIIEMTNGCNILSSLDINNMYKIIIISFLINFSGLSIIAQTYSITYKYKFPLLKYIKIKFIQGIISSIITFIFLNLNNFSLSRGVFNNQPLTKSTLDLNIIFIIQTIILFIPFILKKLFHRIS